MNQKLLYLILISLSISLDSISIKNLSNILNSKKEKKIDTANIVIDLNKGIDLNFIVDDPNKDRISDFFIGEPGIEKVKQKSKDFIPQDLSDKDVVVFETTKGVIKLKLFNDIAPNHALNFKKLCNSEFYDRTSFHRVIRDFMIQGGDILSRDSNRQNDGMGSPGWSIDAEFSELKHKRGTLSMARSSDPNSAGSQFFICVKDSPWLDGKYTIFGKVIEGLDIVDRIVNSITDRDFMLKNTISKIPMGEALDDWIEVIDPVTKKKVYSKIPMGETESSYMDTVRKSLRSNNPYRRIEIITARVYAEE